MKVQSANRHKFHDDRTASDPGPQALGRRGGESRDRVAIVGDQV